MKNNLYSVKGNNLLFDHSIVISVNHDIKDFLLVKDYVLILEDPLTSANDRNIYCFSLQGKFKWQIDEPDKIHSRNYYSSIYLDEDGKLKAYSINGVEVTLNVDDGTIISKELIK